MYNIKSENSNFSIISLDNSSRIKPFTKLYSKPKFIAKLASGVQSKIPNTTSKTNENKIEYLSKEQDNLKIEQVFLY